MKLFFFDLETTGLNHELNGIHQISGMIVTDKEKKFFNYKVRPFKDDIIDDTALKVGNVTVDQIMDYPAPNEVYKNLIELLGQYVNKYDTQDKFFLVGYNNAAFDNQFLRQFFLKNNDKYFGSWFWSNSIDVMVLASYSLMGERSSMSNFKLKTVAKEMGIKIEESKLHDAEYDIALTYEIFKKSTRIRVNKGIDGKDIYLGDIVSVQDAYKDFMTVIAVPEPYIGTVVIEDGEIRAVEDRNTVGLSSFEIFECKIKVHEDGDERI